jgi:hypothetical protein
LKGTILSLEIFARDGKVRALLLGLVFVLAATTLLVYSPALSQSPLFDESFLVAWLSHCIKSGLTAGDTTAYLLAPAADSRDGLTILGSSYILFTALVTGTGYNAMRFLQVMLHLSNALLLFAAVYGALLDPRSGQGQGQEQGQEQGQVHEQDKDKDKDKDKEQRQVQAQGLEPEQALSGRAYALAAVTALYFCLFPLAPEAVASLFGLPMELATTFMLCATVILVWQDKADNKQTKRLLITATVLGMLAPWISLKGALLVILPLVLLLVSHGKRLLRDGSLKPLLISIALIAVSSAPAEIISLANQQVLPEAIKQLTIEKIALTTDSDQKNSFLESGPGANLQAIMLPVNRNIDEKYNKVLRLLYLFLPLPLLLFLAAVLSSARFRVLGLATVLALILGALNSAGTINGQSFYGARWLYPVLPVASLFWALLCISPLFIETGKRLTSSSDTAERVIKIGLCAIFVISLSFFFFQRTYRQSLSYKSNGKLWKVIKESISIAGQKQTSPFIIVRNLPQSLSIEPILSPFSPQLIDSQSGLPRTVSLSAGRLKEALRGGKYKGLVLHFEKQYEGFAGTDLNIIDKPFGPEIDAVQIAKHLKPPMMYLNGAIKFDEKKENLLLESHTRVGPALCMECYGLSPIDGDFLYVDAKINVPQSVMATGPAKLELHWLTNWQGDWEARDRRVLTSGPVSDGQYHRYYFPLRTLAWTTSGLPTNLMLGFPGGAAVAVKAIGLCTQPLPLPDISVTAVHKQDSNKNYFSHYCFNYPDVDDLGLSAVYGHDNGLDINYDVSKVPDAVEAMIEIAPLSEAFRSENSSTALEGTLQLSSKPTKGNLKVASEQLAGGGLFSVRVFAVGADHKTVGHASDSLKCLVDKRL